MDINEVYDKVKNIIVEYLGVDEDQVTLDSNLVIDLGADSLDLVEMSMAVEEVFDTKAIDISSYDSKDLETVRDVVKAVAAEGGISVSDLEESTANAKARNLASIGMHIRNEKDSIEKLLANISARSKNLNEYLLLSRGVESENKCWIVTEGGSLPYVLIPGLKQKGCVVCMKEPSVWFCKSKAIAWERGPHENLKLEDIERWINFESENIEVLLSKLKRYIEG